jgi:oligopeptide/dipeptide ABC transporter ATP-binding protein
MSGTLLDIRRLVKYYPVTGGVFRRHVADVRAVDGVDLAIARGECLGLVGESGCGKTTLGKTILRLHDATSGEVAFDGTDLVALRGRRLRAMRRKMQIVFQDPSNSLNPRMLVRDIIAEPLVAQRLVSRREAEARALEMLGVVGMGAGHLRRYPHEFSGGQRQRIAIARALATGPQFVLMDEPTSALDVSVQAQILSLLKRLQAEFRLTYLFVTHHLLVVKHVSDRIAVMYLGKIVELSPTPALFAAPRHPYSRALLSAIPIPDPATRRERIVLSGDVPNPVNPPPGCRFHPRCPHARDACRESEPALEASGDGHLVACHRWREI